MKRTFIVIVFLLLSFGAAAEEVALNFNGMPLPQFVQAVYRSLLKRDYVLSPDLAAFEKPISLSVRSIKSEDLPQLVESVLSSQGVRSELRNGVYFLSVLGCDGGVCGAGNGRMQMPLSGPVMAAPHGVPVESFGVTAVPSPGALITGTSVLAGSTGVERDVYRPINRRADFLVAALNAALPEKPASAASGLVVLSANKMRIEEVRKLAQQLDTSVHKVKLSATFVEVSSNESNGLGISLVAQVLGAKLGVRLGDSSSGSLTIGNGGFQAVIDALAADGRFKQVAAPTAVLDDYEKSVLSFGDSVPTISSTTLDRNGLPVLQVQYQQSGVLLNVQPAILGNGRINVIVDGQVSSFSATTTGVSGSPTLSKRQVQTTVTLDDGELLIVGGLNNKKEVASRIGLSFLPKSWAARSENSANTDLVLILSASKLN